MNYDYSDYDKFIIGKDIENLNTLQIYIKNKKTDDYILIENNINDIRELYYTLRQFFLISDRDKA